MRHSSPLLDHRAFRIAEHDMLKNNGIVDTNKGLEAIAVAPGPIEKNKGKRKLLVLSDLDSRVKWGASLAAYFQNSCEITIMFEEIPASLRKKYIPSSYIEKQYKDLDPILNGPLLFEYDYIIVALGGRQVLKALSAIADRRHEFPTRPLIIAGFNGLVEPGDSHGFLCRQGADVICVNSKRDMTFFRQLSKEFQLDEAPLVLTGYLRKNDPPDAQPENRPPKSVLFVEQVGRPSYPRPKTHLAHQLAAYARAHPTRNIVIKLRDAGWVRHTNSESERYSFKKIWNRTVKPHPPNVVFSKESVEDILPKMDLCISIASTVIFEALSMGKRVAVVSDFGIGTHMGNTCFIGSGLFASLQDLKDDKIPNVAASWLQENGCIPESFVGAVTARLRTLDEQRGQGALVPVKVYYDKIGFPYVHPRKRRFSRLRKWMFHLRRLRLYLG
ncbi:DUF6716 putative glycosyltransferase [Mesorhizobium yinganensis]|uniref:DUF6716 putative glycosyltransferase n=1 Tax=Mesorhizobium yinganensis TaxID=3157707 RepID=UPI0032B76E88